MNGGRIDYFDYYTPANEMTAEVMGGLTLPQKRISSKYFYDERGSRLFEDITDLEEYYPTRTEQAIFTSRIDEISHSIGTIHTMIEYGSGSSKKIRTLLGAFSSLKEYVPIDISRDFLKASCVELALAFPGLRIKAVCGDYLSDLKLPLERGRKRVIFFPGSTIGNFEPDQVRTFFARSGNLLQRGDGMLIGVDLKKERDVLEHAYNDASGVTAAFNLNVLQRLNEELGAAFDTDQFRHRSFYNEEKGRIEMHLESKTDQTVHVAGREIAFTAGETIHTENSYKYSVTEFQELAARNGFFAQDVWTDEDSLFSVHYVEKK